MRLRRICLYLLTCCLAPAATLDEAARVLSARVTARMGARDRLAVQTRALPPANAAERDAVDRGLREAFGRRVAGGAPAEAFLRVTVSATMPKHVLTAEFRRGEDVAVMIAEYDARSARRPAGRAAPFLEKTLLWEQDERILDAAAGPGGMWILDVEYLTWRDYTGAAVRRTRTRREHAPWPRDARGRLTADGETVRAWLPGQECKGGAAELRCEAGAGAWPLTEGFEAVLAGANEFAGARQERFFTAARLGEATLLLTGANGKLRLIEAGAARDLDFAAGTEVAAIANPCGAPGGPLAAVSSADGRSLALYEFAQRSLRPLGEGAVLPGTLSALWSSAGGGAATAVVATPTGRYAAYRVFAACGR